MDRALQKICDLLKSSDGMRRSAAAIVLAELAPKDPEVVQALGEALKEPTQLLTRHILEAFEAIGTRAVIPYAMPLLRADDTETKFRAVALVAKAGGEVVPQIRQQLQEATGQQRLVLVDLLARIHTQGAFQAILELLFDPDFELVKEACHAVRRHVSEASPKDRATMHRQVAALMNTPRAKAQERVLTSCLLLIGHIGQPPGRAILLKHAAPKLPVYVRRHALIALKGMQVAGAEARSLVRQVLPYIDEPDPNVAQLVLDLIQGLPASGLDEAQWRRMIGSVHAPVRVFAVRKLAESDSAATHRLLLSLLDHEDTDVRENAAGALARCAGAAPLLVDSLAGARAPEAAWRLAKILKPHSAAVDKKRLKKMGALAARELQAGSPRRDPLLYFLRNADPAAADAALRQVGLKFRQGKKWAQAVECLRQLVNTESFDDETRYELGVCNLKQSAKDLAPQLRLEDYAIRGLQALLRNRAFDLLPRLKKDKALDAADLFYVGFHFSEVLGDEKQFGEQLLQHVVKRWPRSPEAKAARNKLKLARPG